MRSVSCIKMSKTKTSHIQTQQDSEPHWALLGWWACARSPPTPQEKYPRYPRLTHMERIHYRVFWDTILLVLPGVQSPWHCLSWRLVCQSKEVIIPWLPALQPKPAVLHHWAVTRALQTSTYVRKLKRHNQGILDYLKCNMGISMALQMGFLSTVYVYTCV